MNRFDTLCANDGELVALRDELRDFLATDRAEHGWESEVDSWLGSWDGGFSTRLGEAGFLGLTIPERYGGRQPASSPGQLRRYVVTEELLAHGAPVAAHWVADRQVAPSLLSYGSEQQRERILPQIAAGTFYSAIGMSEPEAGSDLAAAQTKATRVDGGWRLTGRKVWTSGAHDAHQIVVFARTSPPDVTKRHAGFSQFLVSRNASGLTIDPIKLMFGPAHFNEVIFDDVFVPDYDVLGTIGNGWMQVTAELAFERSGPERFLSTAPLLLELLDALQADPETSYSPLDAAVGDLCARLITLRQMSFGVARALAGGSSPANHAALVKDLGTGFEQDSVDIAADLSQFVDPARRPGSRLDDLLDSARSHSALFTLRGGTNEVLRGVVARGMGLR